MIIVDKNHIERDVRLVHPEGLALLALKDKEHAREGRKILTVHEAS